MKLYAQFLILCVPWLAMVGCHVSSHNSSRHKFSRTESNELETTPLQSLEVVTFNGSIDLQSHENDFVAMEVSYTAYGTSDAEAQAACEQLGTDITAQDGQLILRAQKPDGLRNASVSYKLKVPTTCEVKLETSNGRVSVRGLTAAVQVTTSNGAVALHDVHSQINVRTSNGSIDVQDSSGLLDLHTSNGKVEVAGGFHGENKIRTSNGSVVLSLDPAGSIDVRAHTSNGKISCDMSKQRIIEQGKHDLHAIVGTGDAENPAAQFSVETSNGSVKIQSRRSESSEIEHASNAELESTAEISF